MVRKVDPEVLEGFLQEALGYLPQIRAGLAALAQPDDQRAPRLEEAYRQVHCITGAASLVGLIGLSRIAQKLEHAFEDISAGTWHADEPSLAVLGRGVVLIDTYLHAIRQGSTGAEPLMDEAARLFATLPPCGAGVPPTDTSPECQRRDGPDTSPERQRWDNPVAGAPGLCCPEDEVPTSPEPVAPADDASEEVDPDLLTIFAHEAEDHLRAINQLLPALLEQPGDRAVLQDVRRSAHTLKGSAAMVGLNKMTQLAHRMEDLLDLLYEGQRPVTPEVIALLVAAADALEELASGQGDPDTLAGLYARFGRLMADPAKAPTDDLVVPVPAANIVASPAGPPLVTTTLGTRAEKYVRVPLERLDELVRLVSELVIARGTLEQQVAAHGQQIEELQLSTERLQRNAAELEARYSNAECGMRNAESERNRRPPLALHSALRIPHSAFQDDFDELEFDRYTEFHLLARALTETATDIATIGSDLSRGHGDFEASLNRQAQLSSDLQDRLMRVRMVPLAHLASRLQRTVRGVARAQKKQIDLILEGEKTELDKTVLEEMAEPLLHILRNAADHGIEASPGRRAAGKPEAGTIRVRATQENNQVILQISDDGAGIDPEAVRQTAVAGNFVPAGEAAELGEADLLALLFRPGFSTARQISEVSGRGVGLDIVKTRVQQFKGTVTLTSRPGQGTTFTIRLPLNLALLKALLVKSRDQMYAIPLASIIQIARLTVDAVATGGSPVAGLATGEPPVATGQIRIGDKEYPRLDLARALQLPPALGEANARPPVVLLRTASGEQALVVDQLVEAREVVVKNLGSHLRQVHGVAGATLMGDGSVVLILNPDELAQSLRQPRGRRVETAPRRAQLERTPTILVIDDSPSVRRVVSQLLLSEGWAVLTARDGLEALEVLYRAKALPDVLMVDVEMPRLDGYEFLATVKGQPAFAEIPVVMLTSRAGLKHRRKAEELGASAYLVKPYQNEELLRTIQTLMPLPNRIERDRRANGKGAEAFEGSRPGPGR